MEEMLKKEMKLSTGTTTVGIVGKDHVVLAADKRATMGFFIASKEIEKIARIDNKVYMTMAGSVGDAQNLVRWIQVELRLFKIREEKDMGVKSVANLVSQILFSSRYYPFWVQLLIAGYDEKPRLFSIDMIGGVTEEKFASTGSGSPIAYGVLEQFYHEKNSWKKNVAIAARAINIAMKRDAASGEGVDVVVITEKGGKKLSKEEIEKYLKELK